MNLKEQIISLVRFIKDNQISVEKIYISETDDNFATLSHNLNDNKDSNVFKLVSVMYEDIQIINKI